MSYGSRRTGETPRAVWEDEFQMDTQESRDAREAAAEKTRAAITARGEAAMQKAVQDGARRGLGRRALIRLGSRAREAEMRRAIAEFARGARP